MGRHGRSCTSRALLKKLTGAWNLLLDQLSSWIGLMLLHLLKLAGVLVQASLHGTVVSIPSGNCIADLLSGRII